MMGPLKGKICENPCLHHPGVFHSHARLHSASSICQKSCSNIPIILAFGCFCSRYLSGCDHVYRFWVVGLACDLSSMIGTRKFFDFQFIQLILIIRRGVTTSEFFTCHSRNHANISNLDHHWLLIMLQLGNGKKKVYSSGCN